MRQKTVGILGGMGPEATLDCFAKIIANTPAQKDQDHLRVIIDSNPKVPDRTAAIIGKAESPVPVLVEGCLALSRAGAELIIIPCVSAHFFLAEVQRQVDLPILSIFDAVAEHIQTRHPDINTVGLMATSGTVQGGLFQKRLAAKGIKTIVPDDSLQVVIMDAIYEIKASQATRSRVEIGRDLAKVAKHLVSKVPHRAQAIIAGCTEIPLALQQEHLPVPYFDSLSILARTAIQHAGMTPTKIDPEGDKA